MLIVVAYGLALDQTSSVNQLSMEEIPATVNQMTFSIIGTEKN